MPEAHRHYSFPNSRMKTYRVQRAFSGEKLATLLLYDKGDVWLALNRLNGLYQLSPALIQDAITVCHEYDNGANMGEFRIRARTVATELAALHFKKTRKVGS